MNRTCTHQIMAITSLLLLAGCDEGNNRIVGQLESDRIEITAEFAEPILGHSIVEGEAVIAGQLLSQQNTDRIVARIDEANAALAERRERLAELTRGPRQERIVAAQANVEGAMRDVELRVLEYERAVKLLEQKLASPQLRDRTKTALDVAKTTLEASEANLEELLTGTTLEELAQAEQAVRAAEALLARFEVDLVRHSAVAPVDGIVDSILFEPGERPLVGKPFMILLSGEQPYARIYVPTTIRASVTAGLQARVFVDGLGEPIDGRVRWVSSEAAFTPYFALTEHDRGRLTFFAKVDLLDLDERIPDGVPVEVEFPSLNPGQQP